MYGTEGAWGALAIEIEKDVDNFINNRSASSNYNHDNNSHVIHLEGSSNLSVFCPLMFSCHPP